MPQQSSEAAASEDSRYEHIEANPSKDYLLRTTQQHHVALSMMADQKANIMIAATSILLTFAFANFKQQNLFWGFLALFVFAFIALILAILAVSPTTGRQPTEKRNLLFFGHFNDLTLPQYLDGMDDVLDSDAATYEAIVTDIYDLGTNIARTKYKYLGLSYRVFLIGILAAGILFVSQTLLFNFS
jgi:hypothetical protein